MEILRVRDHYDSKFHEYVVGPRQVESRGVYLTYGEIGPGEVRTLSAGDGHEEIVFIVSGRGILRRGEEHRMIEAGEAVYLDPAFCGELAPDGDEGIRYVAAGGHVPGGHRHP